MTNVTTADPDPRIQMTVAGAMQRHRLLVVIIVVACGALGALMAGSQGPHATAKASLVLQDPRLTIPGSTAQSSTFVADQVSIMQLPLLAQMAADNLHRAMPKAKVTSDDIQTGLSVKASTDSNLVEISYTDADPATAQAVTTAVVDAYRAIVQSTAQQNLDAQLARIDQAIAAVGSQPATSAAAATQQVQTLQTLRSEVLVQMNGANSVILAYSPAQLPKIASGGGAVRFGILGLLLGLLPAAALSYLLTTRRPRFSTRFEPEAVLGRPLLTDVPDFASEKLRTQLPALDRDDSTAAEAFRFLASALSVHQATTGAKSFAIVSPSSAEGKSTVAANFAVTAAREGRTVLAVDADLEGRNLSRLLLGQYATGAGLIQVIQGLTTLDEVVRYRHLGGNATLAVLPCGNVGRSASRLFGSPQAQEVFQALAERYDLVIVDTPPLLQVAYASQLMPCVDLAIPVVQYKSRVDAVEELDDRLRFVGVGVAGYVFNKAPLRREVGQYSRLRPTAEENPRVVAPRPPVKPSPPSEPVPQMMLRRQPWDPTGRGQGRRPSDSPSRAARAPRD